MHIGHFRSFVYDFIVIKKLQDHNTTDIPE
jgi:hypothetical protein